MTSRLGNLRKKLQKQGIDALILFSPANITYLTGYRSRDSFLVVTEKKNLYVTDSRYVEEAHAGLKGVARVVRIEKSSLETIASGCRELGVRRAGFEERCISYADHARLAKAAGRVLKLVPVSGLVEELRQRKSPQELGVLREAVRITVAAYNFIRPSVAAGRKELEIAGDIERFIRHKGATMASFEIIVASGPNAAYPHHVTSSRRVKKGEAVLIDMGVDYCGYKSDLTRVFFSGRINVLTRRVYDIVLGAQERALALIRPGVEMRTVDAAARGYIAAEGYGGCFGHNLGHGVGLQVHEAPALSPVASGTLQEGMVLTVEPGIYLAGRFGIRIEDMVAVTRNGAELLSRALGK